MITPDYNPDLSYVLPTFSSCTLPSSMSLSSCSRLQPVKVKVEKVGQMLTFLRLSVFGMIELIFSGSTKADVMFDSVLDGTPIETKAAESSCSSQPSSMNGN